MRRFSETDDPLYRGDSVETPDPPRPDADPSIVRHVLQVDGPGQESPYLSTSESEETARQFALPTGFILSTRVPALREATLGHIAKDDLLQNLVGAGKGKARWHSAYEVKRAAQLVEQHAEHLVDFRGQPSEDEDGLRLLMRRVFTLRGRA